MPATKTGRPDTQQKGSFVGRLIVGSAEAVFQRLLTAGTLITDSRSVYDKLRRPYISPTGQSKKIDIELLALKNAQRETGLEIRWVNSQAMLANSLTKRGEDEQMNRFVACKQTWRIVEDAEMFSGKRLKREHRDLLNSSE